MRPKRSIKTVPSHDNNSEETMTERVNYIDLIKHKPLLAGLSAFQLFKYLIYTLLSYNLYLFILEDTGSIPGAYPEGVNIDNFVEIYSASIDTASWVLLLLIFELETAILSDERLKSWQGHALSAIKAVCYAVICYAFYGYLSKYFSVTDVVDLSINNACSLSGQGWSIIESLNEYPALTGDNCQSLQAPLQKLNNTQIVGDGSSIGLIHNLAMVDVINAGAWIVLVALLQLEVILQLRQSLSEGFLQTSKYIKGFLYLVLLGAAIYWWIDGSFLDFWDAFLWLIAFIFIDLNILDWHEETQEH
ncbi:hypothetical protein [Pseudoteredinibacter isoporae]|uniref:Shikimate kinase n=1 Tax=Pseudoteredinibacter isoporae TaxID=570281 RepID=A0A7X0MYE9_9GAMM|nr:hypothetical protein [Pseudoteredinibacter isoporae]MBB6521942.1 hypothetical protein [Pseudoteredinibacter isoporae]